MRSALLVGGLGTILVGWAVSLYAIGSMESRESDAFGEPRELRGLAAIEHHQLVSVPVFEGQSLIFEACADDGFQTPAWQGVTFEVWYLDEHGHDRVSAHPFAELRDYVRRNRLGDACVTVSERSEFGVPGELALGIDHGEPLDPSLAEVRVYGHIAAWTPLGGLGRIGLWLILLGTLAFVAGLAWPPKADPLASEIGQDEEPARWSRVAAGLALIVVALLGSAFFQGRMLGALGGLLIAAIEIGAAWFLVAAVHDDATGVPHRRVALGMVKPRRLWLLALAPVVGVLVWFAGRLLMLLVPATGVSPVETFVSFPSGALAMGSVAVFVPVAEEIFFRGFLYGTLERLRGANVATLATIALFALVHLPQQWGAWGAFAAVSVTGIVLTLLRRWTGSTLLTAIVHLAHNAFITMWALM